jgi:hypothetical protein
MEENQSAKNQPIIVQTGNGGSNVITPIIVAASIGGGVYFLNKLYTDWKKTHDTNAQNEAGKDASDINYQMAQNFATLFNVYTWLNASELQKYQSYLSQVTDGAKLRRFYSIITKTRSFDSDVAKYVPAKNQEAAQKNANANADDYSTYKVDSTGKTTSNVAVADLILPKNSTFKFYKDYGADAMKKTLPLLIGTNRASGNWQNSGKAYYVGEVLEFTAIWYVDRIDGSVFAENPLWVLVKHSQEKVFFKVWGIDDKSWYWVDAVEFKRKVARVNGLGYVPKSLNPFQFA